NHRRYSDRCNKAAKHEDRYRWRQQQREQGREEHRAVVELAEVIIIEISDEAADTFLPVCLPVPVIKENADGVDQEKAVPREVEHGYIRRLPRHESRQQGSHIRPYERKKN